MTTASLPYEEPSITQILIFSSFLLALNIIQAVLDKALYCGLVGQVFVGIAWGTPGAQWLPEALEQAVVQLGYLGLILIVFEGGLSTNIATLRANLLLSTCVALTGITAPIALSFLLGPLVGATSLQCFAAGAALCSTSLGTTFAVLSASGLVATRLGSVLSAAAMMDDVVGLVMIQIVSDLGKGNDEISATVVLRPVLVSLAFAVMVPLICRFVLRRFMASFGRRARIERQSVSNAKQAWFLDRRQSTLVIQTALLLGLVAGASYAGTSALFAAYIAGAVGSWWEGVLKSLREPGASASRQRPRANGDDPTTDSSTAETATQSTASVEAPPRSSGSKDQEGGVHEYYYAQAVETVLKPFFFGSHTSNILGLPP